MARSWLRRRAPRSPSPAKTDLRSAGVWVALSGRQCSEPHAPAATEAPTTHMLQSCAPTAAPAPYDAPTP